MKKLATRRTFCPHPCAFAQAITAINIHKVETPAVAKDSNDPWNGMLIWSKEMESAVELMKNAFATENQALKTYCMQRMDLIREEMARCQTSLMGNNSNVVGS